MLDPVRRGPARNHEPHRKTIPVRQRGSVHLVREQRRLLDGLPNRKALDEVGGLVDDRTVGAVEHDLDRLLPDSGLVEHILEPRALPARAAHGAITPFDAGDMRLEKPAAITGALAPRARWAMCVYRR